MGDAPWFVLHCTKGTHYGYRNEEDALILSTPRPFGHRAFCPIDYAFSGDVD